MSDDTKGSAPSSLAEQNLALVQVLTKVGVKLETIATAISELKALEVSASMQAVKGKTDQLAAEHQDLKAIIDKLATEAGRLATAIDTTEKGRVAFWERLWVVLEKRWGAMLAGALAGGAGHGALRLLQLVIDQAGAIGGGS